MDIILIIAVGIVLATLVGSGVCLLLKISNGVFFRVVALTVLLFFIAVLGAIIVNEKASLKATELKNVNPNYGYFYLFF